MKKNAHKYWMEILDRAKGYQANKKKFIMNFYAFF